MPRAQESKNMKTKTKTTKTATVTATKTAAKKPAAVKLNDVQKAAAELLVAQKENGVAPSTFTGRFPTRTLQALEKHALAKTKAKKNAAGVKETVWFPTAKTAKAIATV